MLLLEDLPLSNAILFIDVTKSASSAIYNRRKIEFSSNFISSLEVFLPLGLAKLSDIQLGTRSTFIVRKSFRENSSKFFFFLASIRFCIHSSTCLCHALRLPVLGINTFHVTCKILKQSFLFLGFINPKKYFFFLLCVYQLSKSFNNHLKKTKKLQHFLPFTEFT